MFTISIMNSFLNFILFFLIIVMLHLYFASAFTPSNKSLEGFDTLTQYQIPQPLPSTNIQDTIAPIISQPSPIPCQISLIANPDVRSSLVFEFDLSSSVIPKTDNTGNSVITPYCSTNVTVNDFNAITGNNIPPSDPKYGISVFNDPMFGYVLDIDNKNSMSSLLTNFVPGKFTTKAFTIMFWMWCPDINAMNNNGSAFSIANIISLYYSGPWLHLNTSSQRVVNQTVTTPAGTWAHYCITCDGSVTSYYINNTLNESSSIQYSFDTASPLAFAGAWNGTTVKLNGTTAMKRRFARIKFFNVGLTLPQITNLYYGDLFDRNYLITLSNSYNVLKSNYLNLFIKSQYITPGSNFSQNIKTQTDQYNQYYQDISGISTQIINLYQKLSNTFFVTTQTGLTPSFIPYLTPGVMANCTNIKLNQCQLNARCIYNGQGGWIRNVQNVCGINTPATIDFVNQDFALNLTPSQLIDINGTIQTIKANILKISTAITSFGTSTSSLVSSIGLTSSVSTDYVNSQIVSIKLLVTDIQNKSNDLVTKTSDPYLLDLIKTAQDKISGIKYDTSSSQVQLTDTSNYYQKTLNDLTGLLSQINTAEEIVTNLKPVLAPAPYSVQVPAPYPVQVPAPYPVQVLTPAPYPVLAPAPYPVLAPGSIDSDYINSQNLTQKNTIEDLVSTLYSKINVLVQNTSDKNQLDILNATLNKITDISNGMAGMGGLAKSNPTKPVDIYKYNENAIGNLIKYIQLINTIEQNVTLGSSGSPAPCPSSAPSNQICLSIIPLKYTYANVGCYNKSPNTLFTNFYGKVADLASAIQIANNYGVTVFGLTSSLNMYFGFSYNSNKLTTSCNSGSMGVYAATVSKLPSPSVYEYTIFGSVSGTDLTNAVSKIFDGFDSGLKVGKASSDAEARALANNYGATAFYVDSSGHVYITYNFDLNSVLQYANTTTKSSSAFKNQLYYARFRTKAIQLNNDLYCNY